MPVYCRECHPEKKQAKYGPAWGKPSHCAKHGKSHGFVDVSNKRCEHDGCIARPSFGIEWKRPTHCAVHKFDEMIDVINKRCKHDGCFANPSFGIEWKRPTHCGDHKLPEMIDVKSKRCERDGCFANPSFGVQGERPSHCVVHKSDAMIDVKHKRCERDGCFAQPSFGFARGKATHCCEHQLPLMADVVNQRCTECKTTCTQQNDKLCSACRQVQQLGASRKLIRIEHRIIAMLLLSETIPDDDRTKLNKSIGATCGSYRPDIYIDCGSFVLIIEIDENQHRQRYISRIVDGVVTPMVVGTYSSECENTRMLSIVSKEQMPVYFIRFNPDKCTIDGKAINVSFEKRCEALRDLIKSVIANGTPDALMTISYMYYDGALLRTETPDLPAGF